MPQMMLRPMAQSTPYALRDARMMVNPASRLVRTAAAPPALRAAYIPVPRSNPTAPVKPVLLGVNNNHNVQQVTHPARSSVACQSASSTAAGTDGDGMGKTLTLGALFGGWYLFNIYFNIYNKQVLTVFPFPVTCTTLQFAVGAVVALLLWTTGLLKRPKITPQVLLSILPLAVVHCLGNLLTNCSLGAVAVSFTHTIKAMEPFFSVILSWLFLAERPHPLVLATLFPIVGGVAAASLAEASFNWTGFLAAMGSNLTFQSRNVLSKKLMVKKEGLDNINLFSIITIMALFLLLPFTLVVDGIKFTPQALEQLVRTPWLII